MRIDQMVCTGCGECIPYCPVKAIKNADGAVDIAFDECVECGSCIRYAPCPSGAIEESPEAMVWPRAVRREFSNTNVRHSSTGGQGRGTEESKSNDVTGRVKRGFVGMGMEFGRPVVGTRLSELEKMATALAAAGVRFEPENPVTFLMSDLSTGTLRDDVRNERVLSAILECEFEAERLTEIVPIVRRVAEKLDTVFSLCFFTRLEDDGTLPILPALQQMGLQIRPNAKVNMGLGRPLVSD